MGGFSSNFYLFVEKIHENEDLERANTALGGVAVASGES
jgi:hypothetical protein